MPASASFPRLLFFTPSLARTGSEVALHNVIRSLPPERIAGVVTLRPGELAARLPAAVPRCTLEDYQTVFPGGRWSAANRACASLRRTEERFFAHVRRRMPADVWVVNTIIWPQVLDYAARHGIPTIVHVCELEPMLVGLAPRQIEALVRGPRLTIAISSAVAAMLRTLGRNEGMAVCPPALDTEAIVTRRPAAEMRRRLGIAPGAFVWAMSGTIDPNKNASLFVDLAARVTAGRPEAHFLWIKGGRFTNAYETYCLAKTRALGLEGRVTWTETVDADYHDHLAVCDGFVLPSTRESFSLVSAEALWLGKPVVAFDCGGVVDVVPPGGGLIVRPYDADALVAAMRRVMDGGFVFDAAQARETVARFDRRAVARRWEEMIAVAFVAPHAAAPPPPSP